MKWQSRFALGIWNSVGHGNSSCQTRQLKCLTYHLGLFYTWDKASAQHFGKVEAPSEKKGKKTKQIWMVISRMLSLRSQKVRPVASWSMTWLASDSLVSRLSYKISCKSPQKWPLYLYATDATIVIPFILNFPVVVFYTVYFLWHIKVPWMIHFCTLNWIGLCIEHRFKPGTNVMILLELFKFLHFGS